MATTPLRNVRVPDDVWAAAQTRADRERTTLTAVILAALREYAEDDLPRCVACGMPESSSLHQNAGRGFHPFCATADEWHGWREREGLPALR